MIELELNTACRPDIRLLGEEKTPVVVLDDPVVTTEDLLRYAREEAVFAPDSEFQYPGVRARLPDRYVDVLAEQLVGLVSHVYNPPRSAKPSLIHQVFSLITTRPEDLAPLQRVPHTDSRLPFYFATVHYLNAGEHAGTGFFRHRPTGFERLSEERYPRFIEAASAHLETQGLPAEKYIDATDDHFELLGEVGYRPNRLVVYPGNLLHSGLIKPDVDINDDPARGRLTANLFLYFA